MSRGKSIAAAVIASYAFTWIGGYLSHRHELAIQAAKDYAYVQKVNRERGAGITLNEDGPSTGIIWCVPVLPGILIAESYSFLGPLTGGVSTKTVVYYGFGSFVLAAGGGWRA